MSFDRPGQGKPGAAGRPLEGLELRISEPGEDATGEIQVRGPSVFKGYLNRPEATEEVLDAEGWFHTGDLGRLDQDGYLHVGARLSEMIVLSGGTNVAPETV